MHYPWGCKTAKEYDAEFKRRKAAASVWQDGPVAPSIPAPTLASEPTYDRRGAVTAAGSPRQRYDRPMPADWKLTPAEWDWYCFRSKGQAPDLGPSRRDLIKQRAEALTPPTPDSGKVAR